MLIEAQSGMGVRAQRKLEHGGQGYKPCRFMPGRAKGHCASISHVETYHLACLHSEVGKLKSGKTMVNEVLIFGVVMMKSIDVEKHQLSDAAKRALAEAEMRRAAAKSPNLPPEQNGPKGPEPTRFGDWEKKGITSDF